MKQSPAGTVRPTRLDDGPEVRLARLRRLAWLLDRSISIGGYRIGLDPILGLLPGAGDVLGAGLSTFILYDAARLGLPVRILLKMIGNVLLEMAVGAIPVLGDLFDFAWRANVRNLELVERHYDPLRRERPPGRIVWGLMTLMVVSVALGLALAVLVARGLWLALDRAG